ncbi:MAG: dihydroorotate dehydrogenase electron transfer subunit [Oscillospiraceae bacterium]|nr:dihydroorotate dehydrogenase electron transfer subunit [Oscillospiraceae bacterium]
MTTENKEFDMFYCGKYPIIEKKTLAKSVYSFTIDAPELADEAQPGQFANIAAPGFTLRRPISICGIDKENGTLRFVFEVRGKGTEEIASLTEGESLDVLGPLGNGFRIPDGKKVVVVGGGIGVPPLLGVSKVSRELCTAVLGFRDYSKIILTDEFKENGSETIICTDDGSVGQKGLVTFPLADILEKGETAAVLACGPEPMLKAVVKMCELYKVPCQVSLEQRMGCGVGACVVCSCMTVRNGQEFYSRVCKDGPVFNAEEVKFNG